MKKAFLAFDKATDLEYSHGISTAFERIGSAYRYLSVIDSAIHYLRKGIQFDKQNNLRKNIPSKYNNLGLTFRKTRWSHDSSRYYYLKGIEAGNSENNLNIVSKCQNNLANLYKSFGYYEEALKVYLQNLQLREKMNDSIGLASTLNNLGNFFAEQKKYRYALQYYERNLKINLLLNDSLQLARSYNNIGTILYDSISYDTIISVENKLADDIIDTKTSKMSLHSLPLADSALDNFSYARKIYENGKSNQLKYRLAGVLNNIGNIHLIKKETNKSIKYYKSSLKIYEELGENYKISEAYNNLGNAFRLLNWPDSALLFLKKAKKIADQTNNGLLQTQISWNLSKTLRDIPNDTLAFNFLMDYHIRNYDIWNSDRDRIIHELESKYQNKKKEQQISLQQAEIKTKTVERNGLMITLIVGASLALIIIFFYQQRQKALDLLRQKEKALYDQKVDEMLKEQELQSLNASIQAQEKERQRIAEDLHDRLGSKLSAVKLHYDAANSASTQSGSLQKAHQILDETIEETRKIAHNLASGVLTKFGLVPALEDLKNNITQSKKITIELHTNNLEGRLSNNLEIGLYRIVQEAISNILKHAKANHIVIQLTRHIDDHLNLMIEDNGIGFDIKNRRYNGMGVTNMTARAQKFGGKLTIDSQVGHGTTITVDLPVISPVS